MKGSEKETEKHSLMDTKEFRWTFEDWRGLIAIATLIGLGISVVLRIVEGVAAFSPLAMYVIKKYFDAKQNENVTR